MGVILDTSVLIATERSGEPLLRTLAEWQAAWGDPEVAISVITAYELLHGVARANTARLRARREGYVEEVLARLFVAPVGLPIARIAAMVDAKLRSRGVRVATADLLIGSTTLALGFELATANRKDFAALPGLRFRPMP